MEKRKIGYNTIIRYLKGKIVKKFTPLIVLAMFLVGAYFMIQGMEEATALAHPQKVEKK